VHYGDDIEDAFGAQLDKPPPDGYARWTKTVEHQKQPQKTLLSG
jgi:hypothetical protein